MKLSKKITFEKKIHVKGLVPGDRPLRDTDTTEKQWRGPVPKMEHLKALYRKTLEFDLTDQENWIVSAVLFGEMDFVGIARVIHRSESTAWRIFQRGIAKLKVKNLQLYTLLDKMQKMGVI